MMKLTQQYLDTQASIHVKDRKKEGELPSSMGEDARPKRSPHCFQVVDHYLTNMTPW